MCSSITGFAGPAGLGIGRRWANGDRGMSVIVGILLLLRPSVVVEEGFFFLLVVVGSSCVSWLVEVGFAFFVFDVAEDFGAALAMVVD